MCSYQAFESHLTDSRENTKLLKLLKKNTSLTPVPFLLM